jgi:hypothetical protein
MDATRCLTNGVAAVEELRRLFPYSGILWLFGALNALFHRGRVVLETWCAAKEADLLFEAFRLHLAASSLNEHR